MVLFLMLSVKSFSGDDDRGRIDGGLELGLSALTRSGGCEWCYWLLRPLILILLINYQLHLLGFVIRILTQILEISLILDAYPLIEFLI